MFLSLLLLWEAYGKLIFFFAFSSPLNLRIEEASEEEEKGGIIPKAETNERTKADGWMDGSSSSSASLLFSFYLQPGWPPSLAYSLLLLLHSCKLPISFPPPPPSSLATAHSLGLKMEEEKGVALKKSRFSSLSPIHLRKTASPNCMCLNAGKGGKGWRKISFNPLPLLFLFLSQICELPTWNWRDFKACFAIRGGGKDRETLFQREGLLESIRCDRNTFLSSVECRHLSFFTFRSSGKKRVKRGEDESCSMPAGIFRQSFRLLLPLSFLPEEEEENSRVIKMDDDDAEIIVSHAPKYVRARLRRLSSV